MIMKPKFLCAYLVLLHCPPCTAETPTQQSQLPEDELWQDGNLQRISEAFGCIKNTEHHGIEDSHFHALYQAYHAVIPPQHATLQQQYTTDGWKIPISIKFDEDMGRGIFTDAFVPEGTAVWSPHNAAEFPTVADFRRFLEWVMLFPEDRASTAASSKDLICDTLMWSYTAKKSKNSDNYIVCVDFDSGSLINLAHKYDRNIQQDVRLDQEDRYYGCQEGTLYANRDIEAGEELRMYYGDFSESDGWHALGLRWS